MIFLGDFNVTDDEHHIKSFSENYGLKNIIRQPACYKNSNNPACIDLILTHVPRSFQSTCVVETGLSDFHLMTLTVMRKSFKKYQPKTVNYRSYKNFFNEKYREKSINNLSKENQIPFFNKELSKTIMTRTNSRNIFLQNRNEKNRICYAKQRNFCVSLLRKTKNRYYENLNEKSVVDNKLSWKTVKPLLSDKVASKDKIYIIEYNELVKADLETVEVLNNFFSNI